MSNLDEDETTQFEPVKRAETAPPVGSIEDVFNIQDPSEEDKEADAAESAEAAEKEKEEADAMAAEAESLGMTADDRSKFKDKDSLTAAVEILRRKAASDSEAREALASNGGDAAAGENLGLVAELDKIEAADEKDALDPDQLRTSKVFAKALRELLPKSKPASSVSDGMLDAHFGALPATYADIFGPKVSTGSLAERSPQRVQRRLIVEETARIVEKARAAKRAVPSETEAFQQALRALHAEKVRAVEASERTSKIAARQGQFMARPGGSNDKLQPGRRLAVTNLRAKMREIAAR